MIMRKPEPKTSLKDYRYIYVDDIKTDLKGGVLNDIKLIY
jgi:hypothetical protein